jgi:hypothetical protein
VFAPSQAEGYADSRRKPFVCRFYAESPSNPFIYRIYAIAPGCGGLPSLFSRHTRHSIQDFLPPLRPLCFSGKLRIFIHLQPLCRFLPLFSQARPLFSSACSLFSKNTRVGGWVPGCRNRLRSPRRLIFRSETLWTGPTGASGAARESFPQQTIWHARSARSRPARSDGRAKMTPLTARFHPYVAAMT